MTQPQYSSALPPAKRSGFPWLIVGCGCLSALALLFVVMGVAMYFAFSGAVETYSDKSAMELPLSAATPEETKVISDRIAAFRDAVKNGTPAEPLVLSADDINSLIANDPDWAPLKGRLNVSIDGDKVSGQISIPLDKLHFPGRYFNGSGTFSVGLQNGVMQVHIESGEVKGQHAPEQIMGMWRSQNLAEQLNTDPKFRATIEGLESIEVKDGKITFTPKTAEKPSGNP